MLFMEKVPNFLWHVSMAMLKYQRVESLKIRMMIVFMLDLFDTLWLLNMTMDNSRFIDDFPSYKPTFVGDFRWPC